MTERAKKRQGRTFCRKGRPLSLVQVNIGSRSGPNHDAALNRAWSIQADIIMIQEPWTALMDGKRKTKTHPRYDTFCPVEDWSEATTTSYPILRTGNPAGEQ